MLFGIIMSILLISAALALFITSMGRMLPVPARLFPLVELVLLWLYLLVGKDSDGWLNTVFLVQYWFFFIFAIMANLFWVFHIMDREHRIGPIALGNEKAAKEILMVYHPGASDFTGDVLRELSGRLTNAGYKVVMYSARGDLRLDLGRAAAVGLASPVYAGSIRPPLQRFLTVNALEGIKCFLVLTGSVAGRDEEDFKRAVPQIEERGGRIVAKIKIIQGKDKMAIEAKVDTLAQNLLTALGG